MTSTTAPRGCLKAICPAARRPGTLLAALSSVDSQPQADSLLRLAISAPDRRSRRTTTLRHPLVPRVEDLLNDPSAVSALVGRLRILAVGQRREVVALGVDQLLELPPVQEDALASRALLDHDPVALQRVQPRTALRALHGLNRLFRSHLSSTPPSSVSVSC